jgi:hypothetical protein
MCAGQHAAIARGARVAAVLGILQTRVRAAGRTQFRLIWRSCPGLLWSATARGVCGLMLCGRPRSGAGPPSLPILFRVPGTQPEPARTERA